MTGTESARNQKDDDFFEPLAQAIAQSGSPERNVGVEKMTNMIRALALLCIVALLVSCGRRDLSMPKANLVSPQDEIHETVQWGVAKAGLQCRIACSSQIVTPSKPVDLILSVRNKGNAPVQYHIGNCDGPTYHIQGSWPDGANLTFSDLLQQEHYPCGVTNWISLGAGETNTHILALRMGTFLKVKYDYLFVGSELGSPIEQYGVLSMTFRLMDIESNTIQLTLNKETP